MSNTEKNPVQGGGRGLSRKEIAAFCTQIAMILKSGIPLGEGLEIMSEDIKNPAGRAMLQEMSRKVEQGDCLCRAMEQSGQFPKYVVDMTDIGEQTGRIEDVMNSLCEYYEREEAIARSIRSAVTYPMVMVGMIVIVMAVLVVEVLPVFNQVFEQLGAELTGFALSMMHFGQSISRYSIVLIGLLVVIVAAIVLLCETQKGRDIVEKIKTRFFVTRKLYAQLASGRFASCMSMMLASGLSIDQSLDMACNVIDNPVLVKRILSVKSLIAGGAGFSDAMVKTELFTGVYARMLSVGFKTGSVAEVMNKLAALYEDEVNDQIAGVISIVEPTIVAFMSIVVGMVLLSVMVPLMGIMSSIGMV